jgi:pyruvate kinase
MTSILVKPCASALRTTIVATLGPASSSVATLKAMLKEGMSIARLNLAYDRRASDKVDEALASHAAVLENLRTALAELNGVCGVLVSLSGYSVRTAALVASQAVHAGQLFTWSLGDSALIAAPVIGAGALDAPADLASYVRPGDLLVIDDGLALFTVVDVAPHRLLCTARTASTLSGSSKRVTLQRADGSPVRIASAERLAAARDLAEAEWAAAHGADFIDGELDVDALHRVVGARGVRVLQRVNSDALVAAALQSDGREPHVAGTLLLRRQLGSACPISAVPREQRALTEHSVHINRPVLISAQLLESMVRNLRPTRAEVTDAVNAVIEGVAGLVLTAESAVGRDPVAAVRQLHALCVEAEHAIDYRHEYIELRKHVTKPTENKSLSLASTAALCARDIECNHILLVEPSPELSRAVAQFRGCSVAQFCSDRRTANQAMLLRGRVTLFDADVARKSTGDLLALLVKFGFVQHGKPVIVLVDDTLEVFAA